MFDGETESIAHGPEVAQIVGDDRKLVCDRSCSDPHITLIELVSKRRHDVSKLAGDFVCAGHNDVRPKRRLQPFEAIRPPAPLGGSVVQLTNACE